MADIAAERAFLRRHAERQAAEAAAQARRRWERQRIEQERTCWYCFHDAHIIDYGGGPAGVAVLWCRNEVCLCGVPPCPGCDERVRLTVTKDDRGHYILECPFCHHQQEESAYA